MKAGGGVTLDSEGVAARRLFYAENDGLVQDGITTSIHKDAVVNWAAKLHLYLANAQSKRYEGVGSLIWRKRWGERGGEGTRIVYSQGKAETCRKIHMRRFGMAVRSSARTRMCLISLDLGHGQSATGWLRKVGRASEV